MHATSHAFIALISNNFLFVSWAITPEVGYKFYIGNISQIKGDIENIESPMHRYLNVLCHKKRTRAFAPSISVCAFILIYA